MINAYLSGKDIYATTAALVYNVPYEHCLESYGKEGKKRRTSMKSVILGIMYYRGANSIAEELGISPGAAKSIISKFYQNFPTIKQYVDDSINFCYKNGYVKTVWGRKIRIPELQLPPYEYTSKLKLDAETKQQIEADLSNIWNRDKKRERISWYKKNYGIKIKDNTGRIHAAKRQVVNSIIQGNCIALTY
jgi:DNA polymerase I-like protein with 3'-5' exonuclease and polymerase domains